jgi:hypothetical protein
MSERRRRALENSESIYRRLRHYFRLRLGTFLLMLTAATVAIAHFNARTTRGKWQSQLQLLEAANGWPHISDISKIEIAHKGEPLDSEWVVWVPDNESVRLRFAIERLDQEFPSAYTEEKIGTGRHFIHFSVDEQSHVVQLTLNSKILLERRESNDWNVSPPFDALVQVIQLGKKPATFILARGAARLRAGEEYDPSKHQFGLRLWALKD